MAKQLHAKIDCPDCLGDGYHETYCPLCSGSGEGMADGTTCHTCRGSGGGAVECETCQGDKYVEWSAALAYYWEKGKDLGERWTPEEAQACLELDAADTHVILQALCLAGYLRPDDRGFFVPAHCSTPNAPPKPVRIGL